MRFILIHMHLFCRSPYSATLQPKLNYGALRQFMVENEGVAFSMSFSRQLFVQVVSLASLLRQRGHDKCCTATWRVVKLGSTFRNDYVARCIPAVILCALYLPVIPLVFHWDELLFL